MVFVCLLDDVALDLHVLHDEVSTVEGVRHDSSDECCGKNYCVRLLFVEEFLYCQLVGKVQLLMRATYKVCIAAG